MFLSAGTRLGPYEIVAALGSGGMGDVYRARDTKLGRDVALKILPESFVHDPDRLARFRREAQVLASLNHPNIGAIYGIDEANGEQFLVLELIEGETLADRIGKGALPVDEALPIARQIVDALEAAHEKGIVHRDLKPANVALTRDGHVKVLDFGLAKAVDLPGASSATMSPTLSIHATQAGFLLGTAAYMAPEQARGKAVDARADIWAFGVVLFEMLRGRRPFDGDEISDTLASILKSEPAWQMLPSETPAAIHRLLRRSLQKDPHQRLQHIGDARLEIDDALRPSLPDSAGGPAGVSRRMRLVWMAAVAAAAAIGVAVGWLAAKAPAAPEMRVEINTPATSRLSSFALSPDGRNIVFSGEGARGSQLWVRSLAMPSARPLPGTEGGLHPFWSPDNHSIGFFSNSKLKRLDIDGGQAQTLANVITPAGGTWNRAGTILYVPNDNGGVFRVSDTGGEASLVTPRRAPGLAIRLPQFLPDDRHFLFFVARGWESPGVYIGDLGSDTVRRILAADAPATYGFGHLLFVREGSLFAQMFDPSTQELSGPATRVSDGIGFGGLVGPPVSTSASGLIAYRTGMGQSRRQLVWFDRSGKQLGGVGEEGRLLSNPSLSPDGRYVVVQRTVQENIDLWSLDLERNMFTRLTLDPGIDSMPLWSPDGRRIIFNSPRSSDRQLVIKRVDATSPDEALSIPSGGTAKIACDWSADGRFLLYKQLDETTSTTDLWVLPMDGKGPLSPFPFVRTPYDERDGQFSPDGKWVAFESDESGQPEIYLQPFPGPGPKIRISTAGGTQVRWRRDGTEVFYIASDNALMAVPITIAAGRPEVATPAPLFKTHVAPIQAISRQQYVVAPDGQRFLIITSEDASIQPITLILNWKPTAQR